MGWPLPRPLLPLLGAAVALGTFASTRDLVLSPYLTWPDASAAWHESLVLPGSLAVGFSAAMAAYLFRRRSPTALPVRPRLGAAAAGWPLAGAACWAMLGHVVGMIPVTALAVDTATWGQLRLVDAAVSLLGLASLVAVGFAGGLAFRTLVVAPFLALMAAIVMILPNSPELRPLALLQPVQQWTATARFVPNPFVVAFSILSSLAIVLAVVGLSEGLLRGRRSVGAPQLAAVGVPVALVAMAFLWRPELYVDGGRPPRVCTDAGTTTVCLHRAYAKSMPQVVQTVSALRAAGASPLLRRVVDLNLGVPSRTPAGTVSLYLRLTPADPTLITQTIEEQVAEQASAPLQPAGCPIRAQDLNGVLRNRLLVDAGFARLADRMSLVVSPSALRAEKVVRAMSRRQFVTFVAAQLSDIRQCRLQPGDFTR